MLTVLRAQRVDEFFLHQPDPGCDLRATLEAAHGFAERGLIGRLGLSNFHAAEVGRCVDLCRKHGDLKRPCRVHASTHDSTVLKRDFVVASGYTQPTLYQGLYNPLNRLVEAELLPVLKKNDISFVAYNILAAGLLTGKHKAGGQVWLSGIPLLTGDG